MTKNATLFSNDAHLITLAEKIGQFLRQKKLKIATAESCTGGGLGFIFTTVSGASNWFTSGFIVYSNLSKQHSLDIPKNIITKHGAVSEETAVEMAKGALKNSNADISIAITGIAGPEGGTVKKPVGTVWFSIAYPELLHLSGLKIHTYKQKFSGNRHQIREKCILFALEKLVECLG